MLLLLLLLSKAATLALAALAALAALGDANATLRKAGKLLLRYGHTCLVVWLGCLETADSKAAKRFQILLEFDIFLLPAPKRSRGGGGLRPLGLSIKFSQNLTIALTEGCLWLGLRGPVGEEERRSPLGKNSNLV